MSSVICTDPARVRFKLSYDLESEYEVDGVLYLVRTGCHHFITKSSYLPTVQALVGTVRLKYDSHPHKFPPSDVVALFPGMVGARFTEDYSVEYDGPEPKTKLTDQGRSTIMVDAWWTRT